MFRPPRSGQKLSNRKKEGAGTWGSSAAAIVVAKIKFGSPSCTSNEDPRLTANHIGDKVSLLRRAESGSAAHREKVHYAQICDRAGNTECGRSVRQRILCRRPKIGAGSPGNRPADTVAAQLCYRQQDLLRIFGA